MPDLPGSVLSAGHRKPVRPQTNLNAQHSPLVTRRQRPSPRRQTRVDARRQWQQLNDTSSRPCDTYPTDVIRCRTQSSRCRPQWAAAPGLCTPQAVATTQRCQPTHVHGLRRGAPSVSCRSPSSLSLSHTYKPWPSEYQRHEIANIAFRASGRVDDRIWPKRTVHEQDCIPSRRLCLS